MTKPPTPYAVIANPAIDAEMWRYRVRYRTRNGSAIIPARLTSVVAAMIQTSAGSPRHSSSPPSNRPLAFNAQAASADHVAARRPSRRHATRSATNALKASEYAPKYELCEKPYALFMGAISEIKQPFLAIEACARLGIKLIIAGQPLTGKLPITDASNVEYVGMLLQPCGFFDRNPAINLPPIHGHHC